MIGLLAVVLLSACSDGEDGSPVVPVESISVSPSSVSVERDKVFQLKAEINPKEATDKKVSWSSSNSQVATVSESGLVTGVSKGTATITATAGGKKAICEVTVTWEVQSVTMSPASLKMTKAGETAQLTAVVLPEGAGEVVWSSSDEAVATVSPEGMVTAVGEGTATITATAGGKKATCEVTIAWEVESVTVSPDILKMTKAGETAQLTAVVLPEGAGEVVWSSSDEAVATVSPEGMVTAVGEGTATITATAGDKSAVCEVTVKVSHIIIEGDKATVQLDGVTAEEMAQTIQEAVAAGARKFVLQGNYAALGAYTTNIFKGIETDVIDLSQVTGWPVGLGGLAMLPNYLFYNDSKADFSGIKEVILSYEIKAMGKGAFRGCKNLKRIEATGIQKLDNQVFQYCTQLAEVNMPELTEIGGVCFLGSGLKKVDFPKVTTVEASAFSGCEQLIEASLPKVKALGAIAPEDATSRSNLRVFADCSKLEKVYLPAVITVGDYAFNGCKALKEIDLPEATEFGEVALMGCTTLVSARLPKATHFRRDVFTDCTALSRLYLLAEGAISFKNTTFGPADHITKKVDLTLHPNKEPEVKDPFVGEGKEWKSHNWKSISFAEN